MQVGTRVQVTGLGWPTGATGTVVDIADVKGVKPITIEYDQPVAHRRTTLTRGFYHRYQVSAIQGAEASS